MAKKSNDQPQPEGVNSKAENIDSSGMAEALPKPKNGEFDQALVLTPSEDVTIPSAPTNAVDLHKSSYYLNRELTWLNFNYRVLQEARDSRSKLLDRLRFVAIVSSNLDEFFMKRIGGLKQLVGAGIYQESVDGRTPAKQIADCCQLVRDLEEKKSTACRVILSKLEEQKVEIRRPKELDEEEQAWLREHFLSNIYPLVTPQAFDPAHPFPFISNLSLNLFVSLRYPNGNETSLARVKVPVGAGTPRFVRLPNRAVYLPLEAVMAAHLDLLFPGMKIEGCSMFRVTRNANTETTEERADDLLAMIESELRERKFAPIVRLEVDADMELLHVGMLTAELGLDEVDDVFVNDGMLGLRDLMELVGAAELKSDELLSEPHYPLDHPEIPADRSIFQVIREADSILLHHPYDNFSATVERFLRQASVDPKVRAIKMCLYRTSSHSKVMEYLIDAAMNGKQVAVVVELKARFDEAANIRWANRLEESGIHVTYGVVGLKTHCKVVQVVRQDDSGLRRYAHVGTGNYHADTARIYTDLGLLTCDDAIGRDLTELFNYLTTGYKPRRHYAKILPSPKQARQALIAKIEHEIQHHQDGQPGHVQFKMNALEDPELTAALYRAAQGGVKVDLIVRDTCRLRPGIPGFSENVRVVSIVGRFLEHARIYYFRNAGHEEYYIGSADCMKRNLDSRVEIFTPIEKPAHCQQLRQILDLQLKDQRCAWDMRVDGSYVQRMPRKKKEEKGVQSQLAECHENAITMATALKNGKPVVLIAVFRISTLRRRHRC